MASFRSRTAHELFPKRGTIQTLYLFSFFILLSVFPQIAQAKRIPAGQSVLIMSRPNVDIDKFKTRLQKRGLMVVNEIRSKTEHYVILEVQPRSGSVKSALYSVKNSADPDLSTAEIKFASKLNQCVPSINDPEFANQLNLQQINFSEMRCLLEAKNVSQVAQPRLTIIDSGCTPVSNEWTNITQFNFVGGLDGVPEAAGDPQVHGTAVAAIAAATTNNGILLAGVASHTAPSVALTCCRVSNAAGQIDTIDVIRALNWCVDHQAERGGPSAINLSLQSFGLPTYNGSELIQDIAKMLSKHKDILINAAGNDPIEDPSKSKKTIRRVGGIDENDMYWTQSTYGPFKAVAPSVNVRTYSNAISTAASGSGTSYAAPHWSGAIALLMSLEPKLTPAKADQLLYKTGKETSQGYIVPDLRAAVIKALKLKP